MTVFDPDPLLRRLERSALAFCALAAVVALVARGGRADVALGIVGGGALAFVSYWAIRSGITGLVELAAGSASRLPAAGAPGAATGDIVIEKPRPAAILLRLAGRYALLGVLAYVMIARLRLHPVGLLIGVSSLVVAASLEAVRTTAGMGRNRPRA